MTFTITIPTWLPGVYLLIGAVLWLPINWWANRRIHPRCSMRRQFRDLWRSSKRRFLLWGTLQIPLWPVALYELAEPDVRKWVRRRNG